MKYNIKKISDLNLDKATNNLNTKFQKLDQLNKILQTILPINLKEFCHIGASDEKLETVVLFVANSNTFHLARNYSNNILHTFKSNGFDFQKILIKIGKYKHQYKSVPNAIMDAKKRDKLLMLANDIGKPELASIQRQNKESENDELNL
jgi:hypothetical protein